MSTPASPFIIGLQGDPTTWPNPAVGKTAFGVNLSGQFCAKQSDGTITELNLSTAGYVQAQNAAGTTTVTISNPVFTALVQVQGSARAVPIVLSEANASAGCVVRLKLQAPVTAGLAISVYDGSTSGAVLFDFTTDGTSQTSTGYAEFSYDGNEWSLDTYRLPAV